MSYGTVGQLKNAVNEVKIILAKSLYIYSKNLQLYVPFFVKHFVYSLFWFIDNLAPTLHFLMTILLCNCSADKKYSKIIET